MMWPACGVLSEAIWGLALLLLGSTSTVCVQNEALSFTPSIVPFA